MSRTQSILIGLIAFILAVGGCIACLRGQRDSDLPYRTGTQTFYDGGGLRKGKLVEPTTIAGWPAQGWIHFHENEQPSSVELAQELEALGQRLPAATRLFFDENGVLENGWLGADVTLSGVPCRGGGKISFSLHPDGTLRSAFLRDDTVISDIPCRSSLFEPIELHPNGKLARALLDRDVELDGVTFEAGDVVQLDEDGKPLAK